MMTTDPENPESLIADENAEQPIADVEQVAEDQESPKASRRKPRILRFLEFIQHPLIIGWSAILISTGFALYIVIETALPHEEFWQGLAIEIYGAMMTVGLVIAISGMYKFMFPEDQNEISELRNEIAELKKLIIEQNQNKHP